MKSFRIWAAAVIIAVFAAGCAGNPNPQNTPQESGTEIEQVTQELETVEDSVVVALDSAKQAIEEATDELNQLLNDLNK